jgi:hypothetical protein
VGACRGGNEGWGPGRAEGRGEIVGWCCCGIAMDNGDVNVENSRGDTEFELACPCTRRSIWGAVRSPG